MQTVNMSYAVRIERPVDEAMEWCRSVDAREGWPGFVRAVSQRSSELVFELDVRTRGAEPALLTVEEHLRPVERGADGTASFESALRWAWPRGGSSSGWAVYEFASVDGGTDLTVEMQVILPGRGATELFTFAPFKKAIERAVGRFVENLGRIPEPAPPAGR
jgi:hypothetical protein